MIILTYHYFSRGQSGWLTCSADQLRSHLEHLASHCHPVSLLEALKTLEEDRTLPSRAVAVTVDDCDVSLFEVAWPIFRDYGVPLFCNVITGHLGRRLDVGTEVELLSGAKLEEMLQSGLVGLGSHSASHPSFDRLAPAEILTELESSKKAIESLQGHCAVFTYPYGKMSAAGPEGERILTDLGYSYAMMTCSGRVSKGSDRLRIARTNITGVIGPHRFRHYSSGAVGRMIQFNKQLRGERFYSRSSPGGRIGTPPRPSLLVQDSPSRRNWAHLPDLPRGKPLECPDSGSVSVIIPAYNNASSVARSIRSALQQSWAPAEVIVVDDGSTDDTARAVAEFSDRVIYMRQLNSGPAAARNAGLKRAQGSLVAFLDADDYWRAEFLGRCCRFLVEHRDAVAVSTGLCFHLLNGKILTGPPLLRAKRPEAPFVIERFFEFWAEQDHIRTGSCVLRRTTVTEAGYQRTDLRITEDLEFWALMATYGPWGFIPEVLWDCDSPRVAAESGWRAKHETRHRLCPAIEDWDKRVKPRLRERDWPGFRRVRGRVAAVLAHNQVLGRNPDAAFETLNFALGDLPSTGITRLLRWGQKTGSLGWRFACALVRLREVQKSVSMDIIRLMSRKSRTRIESPRKLDSEATP